MSIDADPGFWKEVSKWLWALLLPLIGIVYHGVNKDISEVKKTADAALPQKDFDAHLERSLDDRKNLREDVKELFQRDDRMKDIVNERFEDLRRDMHEGFESIRRELRTREGRG